MRDEKNNNIEQIIKEEPKHVIFKSDKKVRTKKINKCIALTIIFTIIIQSVVQPNFFSHQEKRVYAETLEDTQIPTVPENQIINHNLEPLVSSNLFIDTELETDNEVPSTPESLVLIVKTDTTVTIGWLPSTDNVGVTEYDVYMGASIVGTASDGIYTTTNLMPNTSYNFYVRAKDASGNVSPSSESIDVTTDLYATIDTQAPSTPVNLTIAATTGSTIMLEWDASSDDVEIAEYEVYCNGNSVGLTHGTSYTYSGLINHTAYNFYVIARDAAGNSSEQSNAVDITLDVMRPLIAPSNLSASAISSSTILLTWDESPDNIGVVGYDIYLGATLIGATIGENTYTVTGLEQGLEYSCIVKARDEAGNVSEASNVIITRTLLEKPTIVDAIASEIGITINWDEMDNVDGYEIIINGEIINVGNATTYLQTSVLPNYRYEYQVRTIKGIDKSDWSDSVELFTAPDKVLNLTARVVNETTVELTWNAVDGGLTYEVEFNGEVIDTVLNNKFIHSMLSPSTRNIYRIRAINGELKGIWSDATVISSKTVIPGGTISQNTVWDKTGGIYIVQGDLTIAKGVTLQVMEGTIVKFNTGTGMAVNGKLIARGTNENPIIFTSSKDAEYGGSGVTGISDSWRGIYVGTEGEFTGDYVKIRYGGYRSSNYTYNLSALYVQGALNLNNSEISNSTQDGIRVDTGKAVTIQNTTIDSSTYNGINVVTAGDSSFAVENNTITNGGNGYYPISISLGGITSSEVIKGIATDNVFSGNYTDVILLSGQMNVDITLINSKYYISEFIVPAGKTLTLEPGAILLSDIWGKVTVLGTLLAQGTAEKPIILTMINDSEYEVSGITSSYKNWKGIYVGTTGNFTGDYVKIRYGGYRSSSYTYNLSALYVQGALNLNNSEVSNSTQDGIRVDTGKAVTIQNTIIDSSAYNGINVVTAGDSSFTVENNTITNGGNGYYPISISLGGITSSEVIKGIATNNVFSGNYTDVILLSGQMNVDITLINSKYYISEFVVPAGKTLTLEPGAILLCDVLGKITVLGTLLAHGATEKPILFTMINDSEYGVSGITSSYKNWKGIYVGTTGHFTGDYVKIRYGGYRSSSYTYNLSTLYVQGALNLNNSEVSNSTQDGIRVDTGKAVTIQNTIIDSSAYNGINVVTAGDSSFTVENNTITNGGNGYYPISISLGGITSSEVIKGIATDNVFSGNYTDVILLSGQMNVDITLINSKYYISEFIVPAGKTLTLEPGAILLCDVLGKITVLGTLLAHGAAEKPILFTMINDSEYGASGITSSYKNWKGIYVGTTGHFTGDYVKIRYGGYRSSSYTYNLSALYVQGALNLNNSEVSNSTQDGIRVDTGKAVTIQNTIIDSSAYNGINVVTAGDSSFAVENNTITNGGNGYYPISISLGGITSSEVIKGIATNNVFSGNYTDVILLSGQMNVDITLINSKYYISEFIVPAGKTLNLEPGAILLCDVLGKITVLGTLLAHGAAEKPILFTMINDSEYGVSGITSSYKNWKGIYVGTTGHFTGDYVKIRYGGYRNSSYTYNLSALYVSGTLELFNSEISNSYQHGIYFNTSIQPTILCNTFKNNSGYGIYNANSNIIIEAQNNYWNSIYGPRGYMQIYNPFTKSWSWQWVGSGDMVSSNVDYYPYLGSEMTIALHFSQSNGTYAPTGNYSEQFTDMKVNCLKDTLTFARSYNSQDYNKTGVFGNGWSFNYESSITNYEDLDNIKIVKLPDGSQETHMLNSDGSFTSNSSRNTLEKLTNGTYTLTTKDQTKYGFNTAGLLTWIETKEGNRLTISIGTNGKPQSMIDYVGRYYRFSYNSNNLLETISDSLGRTINYSYTNNKLVKVIDPAGIVTNYVYDASGYLSQIRDAKNNLIEGISYKTEDGMVKVDQVADVYNNIKTYTYDKVNGKTIITDSNGNSTTQWYDRTYNITNSTDAEGKATVASYTTQNGENKYSEIESVTDRNGNMTIYKYDSNGNITKTTHPDGSYKLTAYDEKNNLTSECDEAGKYTYYIYNTSKTNLVKVVKPLNGTDPYTELADQSKFAITTYNYYQEGENGYTIKGLIKSIVDPRGNQTVYSYDAYGNMETSTDSASNKTTFTNNAIGLQTSTLSPKGELTQFTYNSNGSLETMVQHGGETTQINYDELGRKIQEISPNIYKITQSGEVGSRYTYYTSGKVHTMTDPENNTTAYTYDLYGNTWTEKKPNGCIYSYEYDALNRVKKVYVQDTEAAEKLLQKSYNYTILPDNKTQMAETTYLNATETATTTYVYDYAGRQVKQTNPDGSIQSTAYNTNGTIYSSTDAMTKTSYFKYDGLNRLTEQWTPFGDSKYNYKTIIYDKNGNKTAEKIGVESVSLWGVAPTLITTSYEYDSNNHVKTATDSEEGRTEYEYDANGNVKKEIRYLNEIDTKVTEYEYNYLGKVVTMTQHVEAGDLYGNTVGDPTDIQIFTTYSYDANGNVLTATTPDNITTTYTYDNLNRPTTQTMPGVDEYGNSTTIGTATTYDYAGNSLTIKDANGNITQNIYNQRGLLWKTIDPEDGITVYYYDNAGRLISKVLPKNYVEGASLSEMSRMVFTYDSMNRVLLEQDIYYEEESATFKTINAKAYQYNFNGQVIKTLDALGYESGTGATIAAKINTGYGTTNTYNDAGLLLTTQSPETKIRGLSFDVQYTYDGAGRKTSETNANNKVKKYYYDNTGRLKKTTIIDTTEKTLQENTYDRVGNVLTQTDGNNNITTFNYNRLGLLRSQTTPGDATIEAYTIMNQYNEMGQLVDQKDSMGKVKQFTYNHNGKVLSQTEQKQDGTQSITITKAYDKNGNLRFATDANGVTTESDYDGLNRVLHTKITVSGKEQLTSNSYDKNGNLLTTTDWLRNTYTNEYDALNRLKKKTDPYGNVIETYEYNNNHAQIKAYDAMGNFTVFAYDKNNRLTSTTDPSGHVTTQTYDKVGNLETKKDGNNNITQYAYDALNRLITVTNAKNEITRFTYDLNGNKLTQTDAKLNTITYTYNAANLLSKKLDPGALTDESKMDRYTYYANGTVKTRIDKNGNLTTYTYDLHGNLKSETIVSETEGSSAITYTYDANGNKLAMTDATGTTSRTYDELGRVRTKTVPNVGTITYEYDITIGVTSGCYKVKSTDPRGNISEKVYDKAGRLYKVIVGTDVTTYTYYDNGSRSSVIYNDGSKEEYTYYENNQIETLVNKKPDGSVMDRYSYTYDNAGNQLTKQENINGIVKGTTIYTYDILNRLLTVTEPNGRVTTYGYDAVGNRSKETIVYATARTENSYTYNNQNRLTDISTKVNNVLTETTSFTYDNSGNQLTSVVKTFVNGTVTSVSTTATNTYDLHNQLTKTIAEDGTEVNNSYNAEGYRVGKEVNGQQTYYLYEADKVILEVDEAGNQIARNVYGYNLLRRTVEGETYYYMYNGHADVTALIRTDGTIAATYYYDAFGNVLESTGDVENSIMYSGYQYDKETGLYYLNARMYDPKIARFLQEDTYTGDPKDPLSLNLYSYCTNNPIIYSDPTGHDGEKAWSNEYWNENLKKVKEEFKKSVQEKMGSSLPWNVLGEVGTGEVGVFSFVESGNNNLLSMEQQQANAKYIHEYLTNEGWTTEAVSALLGNIQVESHLNPGQWQYMSNTEYGYGLVQWDDASKFLDAKSISANEANEMAKNNPEKLMDLQLEFLIDTMKPGAGEWLPSTAVSRHDAPYKMSYNEFIGSTNDVGELTIVFNSHYERSGTPHMDRRIEYAEAWYDYFSK